MNNNVKSPPHYRKGGIECITAIRSSMTERAFIGFCKGNVIKYVFRYEDKNGVEDLEKAAVYLNWMIEAEKEAVNKNDGEA